MSATTSEQTTFYASIALAIVYIANVLYARAISSGAVDPVGGFAGLGGGEQVVLLLVMSAFFALTILLRADE